MNDLVPIEPMSIGGTTVQTVNARKLWAYIESKQEFANWIKGRIEKYGFVEGEDFTVEKFINGRASGTDYHITIEMGKELAMVENNEKGREVRRYFIECERAAKQAFAIPQTYAQALQLAADQARIIEEQRPAVEFLSRYVEAKASKGIREVAKILGAKEREFVQFLLDEHVMFRQGASLLPYAEHQHAGRFEVKTGTTSGHAYHQSRFTPAGVAWIANKWAGFRPTPNAGHATSQHARS